MLTIVATPLGNLSDISQRAVDAMRAADIVLCEDTRVTKNLYALLDIAQKSQFISYHKFNEAQKEDDVLSWLKAGKKVVLVSDAGTPAVSDPGQKLIARCHEEQMPVSIIPGPCAAISAFAVSGFSCDRFQFLGFLPKEFEKKQEAIKCLLEYPGATIIYESPERVVATLEALSAHSPNASVAFVRELTKKFEEILVASVNVLKGLLTARESIKGEITLVINPPEPSPMSDEKLVEMVAKVREKEGVSLSEACHFVAELTGISKKNLYKQYLHHLSKLS